MFNDTKYTKWYTNIVNSAKNRQVTDEYYETHHIIPKSLGGDNTKNNTVKLTAREHFICHLILPKMLLGDGKQKMIYALWKIANQQNKYQNRVIATSKSYEIARKAFSEVHSERMRINHPLKNPENRKKHQLGIDKRGPTSVKGRKMSDSGKEKLRNKIWTEVALQNRLDNCLRAAAARKGSVWSSEKHAKRFNTYLEKNKLLFPQVYTLYDSGINVRQISLTLGISWDRVNYMIANRTRLNTA
jgi:hypothetical protein